MNPQYPIYIVSKGRWASRLTAKALEACHVPYRIVIEPQEFDQYSSVIEPSKILVLPFSELGQGSIPARNWIWDHSLAEGHRYHWILDDNIRAFLRLLRNHAYRLVDGAGFCAIEDFVARYENIALAGMQYDMFAPAARSCRPVQWNTRIYSCILIRNDLPFRWRGRYNEDTDLSLRVLKAGWCTALIYAFLVKKIATMRMTGGNTDTLYKGNGRLEMARSLQQQHPDVTKIVHKWGRWQHSVDYSRFRSNLPLLKPSAAILSEPYEYGMIVPQLQTVSGMQ